MAARSSAYPVDPWKIRERSFDRSMLARNETIFSLGNGHLGLRGNFEEGYCNVVDGTYINGFFEETPIVYGEIAFGYAKNRQVMLNVADGKIMRLFLDDEPFDLSTGRIISYERSLDLREGILRRELRWLSPSGIEIELKVSRLVSLVRRSDAAIDYRIRVTKGNTVMRLESSINGETRNQSGADDPRIGTHFREPALTVRESRAEGLAGLIVQVTTNTRLTLAAAMTHRVEEADVAAAGAIAEPGRSIIAITASGSTLHVTKHLGYFTSRDYPAEEIAARSQEAAAEGARLGFESLAAEQREALDGFWRTSDVTVDGDEALQQSIRFNLLSLYQSAGRDGRTSIAAKGLSGEGYEGHYFWDTEVYVLPFFTYTNPEVAAALVGYRCGILDKARIRAAEMSQRGALFPWRTIGGEETSPYYPAGTAQYHINADIVFALRKYVLATGDESLLLTRGAALVFETARLWADLGDFVPQREGEFCINEVTGPDEYTALVNNNLYTNLMAQANLEWAVELYERFRTLNPSELSRIAGSIGLGADEVEGWKEAAVKMRLPFDRELGIHAQDDQFLRRAVWDFASTPAASYPLLLHFHPLVIYRYQVLKQPDVVLAQVLRGDRFSAAEKKRNFDYYDAITTGDSSLSPCIQSVAAAEIGYTEKAYEYFMRTARMDLDDVNGNVENGIHTAAMAGTWISLVNGFAGMRDYGGELSFSPRLPARWKGLRFTLLHRGCMLEVSLTGDEARYSLLDGEELSILHKGERLTLRRGSAISASLRPVLRAVVFDLDGVITDTAEFHYLAWKRLADEIGIPFDRTVNERLRGVGRLDSLDIILSNGDRKPAAEERARLADRKNGYYKELIGRITPKDMLPGISLLFAALRRQGIRIAIASVSHNVWEVVKRLEIERAVDLVVDPASIVKGKPDPEIFLRAAETFGVPFECCAGIEDARAGVAAIKAAGMFAVGIGQDLPGADLLLGETSLLTLDRLSEEYESWALYWR